MFTLCKRVADDKLRQQLLLSAAHLFGFRFCRCAIGLRRDYNGNSLCAGRRSFCNPESLLETKSLVE
jgi:hypothetical protein